MQDKYGHLALTDKTDSLETLIKCTDYLRGTNIETIEFKARMKLLKMHLPKNWWIIVKIFSVHLLISLFLAWEE